VAAERSKLKNRSSKQSRRTNKEIKNHCRLQSRENRNSRVRNKASKNN
jgi:hypothetical protein